MKIAICAAGTGGHIYPGIAFVQYLKSAGDPASVMFFCSNKMIDKEIFKKEGLEAVPLISSGLMGNFLVSFFKAALFDLIGYFQSLWALLRSRPDVLLSMGGYLSLPVVVAASTLRIPVVLHEQNAIAGRANRMMSRLATKIAVTFEESASYFPAGKTRVTGNPVRKKIIEAERTSSRIKLSVNDRDTLLLVAGGSQGARSINDAVIEMLPRLNNNGLHIVHACGEKDYQRVRSLVGLMQDIRPNYSLLPYIDDISSVLAASDLVISRSGATMLCEIAAKGVASLLIPYPHSADGHQKANARLFENKGAAVLLEDGSLKNGSLEEIIIKMTGDKQKLRSMGDKALMLSRPDASKRLKELIDEAV